MSSIDNKILLLDDLKNLHSVLTKNYHSELELFKAYLEIGCNSFQLETGIVSKIKNNTYTVLAYSSPLEGLEVGQVFELNDTYCREVYQTNKTVAFPHVGSIPRMYDHPVYVNMHLESYISAPIYVNGNIYGTINFTDRKIKHDGFSSSQFELLEILANTIGKFLEAKIYKDQLKAANNKIKEFVGVVAHDLKNPLGSILSLVQIIEAEESNDVKSEMLNLIKATSENSLEMVQSVLDMCAIEIGKVKITKKKNNILETIEESWSEISFLARKKEMELSLTGGNIEFDFDKQRLMQSFNNLFTNAIKFSYRGRKIEVSVIKKDTDVRIKFIDHGKGISEKQITSIWDSTISTSTPGTEGELGTGYGLPLVKQIIEAHGGTITVESNPGILTVFTISLPL